jgi:sec-independent protein translocase protein TatB
MFGLSFGELLIIAILALILLGPDKLPDAAKTFAKGLKELRRATDDLKDQLGTELSTVDEVKRTVTGALERALDAAGAEAPAPGAGVPNVPLAPRPPPPAATVENVPGLEAALVDPAKPGEPPAGGGAAP